MNQQAVHNMAQKLVLGAIALLVFALLAPAHAYAQDDSQYTVHVDTGYLALRTAPAYDDSNIIGELRNGDVVTVEDKKSGDYWWVYSPKLDKSGYVNKNNLMTAYSYGDYRVKVDQGYLALRNEAAYDDSNIIGELDNDDVVTLKDSTNDQYWWVYSPKYNTCGYVDKNYLVTAPATYSDYVVKVEKGYLALRTAPAYDDSNIIGELHNGDVVTVEAKRGGRYWWVYSPQLNREGYVDADYLTAV